MLNSCQFRVVCLNCPNCLVSCHMILYNAAMPLYTMDVLVNYTHLHLFFILHGDDIKYRKIPQRTDLIRSLQPPPTPSYDGEALLSRRWVSSRWTYFLETTNWKPQGTIIGRLYLYKNHMLTAIGQLLIGWLSLLDSHHPWLMWLTNGFSCSWGVLQHENKLMRGYSKCGPTTTNLAASKARLT